jgi:hypothetical protein
VPMEPGRVWSILAEIAPQEPRVARVGQPS